MNGATKSNPTTAITVSAGTVPQTQQQSGQPEQSGDKPANDIFLAAQYGDWKKIEELIQAGSATANDKNEQGITPLHWAAINDRLLACKTLVDHGAEVNATGGDLNATPMMWAAKNGHVYIVHLLITYGGDPALVDNQGYNVLQLATHSSNIMLVIYLLHIDLPVDSIDPQGHTCLMWATYQGDALSVNAFLKWGANVNAKDSDGLNALHWSIVRGNRQCIKRVIEEGGDLSAKQNEGKDPRTLAKELKTITALESALESVGRDADTGLCKRHWLSVVCLLVCALSPS
jgi:palmitoyltransferase ZDHHC13/17